MQQQHTLTVTVGVDSAVNGINKNNCLEIQLDIMYVLLATTRSDKSRSDVEEWVNSTRMEKNDAQSVKPGLNEELCKEIIAQSAVLDCAISLINQARKNSEKKTEKEAGEPDWVYNMKGLEEWIHHYTERRKLNCPVCKEDREFVCTECLTQYKYHDEL